MSVSVQQPAHEYARLLETGQLTSQDLVTAFLDQIDRHNHDGIKVNAILSICPKEVAISRARQLDEERHQGKVRSDLHGMPIVLKDAIVTHPSLGMITSAGACAIASLKAKRNASIVDRVRCRRGLKPVFPWLIRYENSCLMPVSLSLGKGT